MIPILARSAITISLLGGIQLLSQEPFRPYSVLGPPPSPQRLEQAERLRRWMDEGWHLTPSQALDLEAGLARNPANLPVRLRLISYYGQHLLKERGAGHLLWLIENHPESEAFQNPGIFSIKPPAPGAPASPEYQRSQALWREQAARFPHNPAVLANVAINVDPGTAIGLIEAAHIAEPENPEWTRWLAKIYADAIRWTFWDGKSMMAFTGDAADFRHPGFLTLPLSACSAIKQKTDRSTDGALLEAIGETLVRDVRLLQDMRGSDSSPITPEAPLLSIYGEQLIARSHVLVKPK